MTDARRRKKKRWSYSVGERGKNRVRAYAHAVTGRIFLEVYEPIARGEKPRIKRIALGHSDTEEAKTAAERLAAELRRGAPAEARRVSLARLFDIYLNEVTPTKASGTQQHDRTAAALFLRAFGPDRDPMAIGLRDWQRFVTERRTGRLAPKGPKGREKPRGVGDRQLAYDLKFLLAVLN